jgi:hypothetical protein
MSAIDAVDGSSTRHVSAEDVGARQFGKGGGPVHVAVAHQDELRVDSLRKERFCEGFVEFGHGRGPLG